MVLFRGGLATLENAGFNREHWCRELRKFPRSVETCLEDSGAGRASRWMAPQPAGDQSSTKERGSTLQGCLPVFFSSFPAYFHSRVSKTCRSLK